MIVYEFWLKEQFKEQAFEALCDTFYNIGKLVVKRKVDKKEKGSAVYSVSRNPRTHWVQLLVDDNTPPGILTAIEARINGLCDTTYAKYSDSNDHIAPMERQRGEMNI